MLFGISWHDDNLYWALFQFFTEICDRLPNLSFLKLFICNPQCPTHFYPAQYYPQETLISRLMLSFHSLSLFLIFFDNPFTHLSPPTRCSSHNRPLSWLSLWRPVSIYPDLAHHQCHPHPPSVPLSIVKAMFAPPMTTMYVFGWLWWMLSVNIVAPW